ncbi:hypothetical protein L6452_22135 [Arctium lappa]|uniref:Uncharacterized protein n=1 Tax=Arctium lappa TaxID=4217 RepID=A0ACB9B393_ARCLA|nr:hypothetical protein L6452_22135 [Arctium lappa]
MRTSLKDLVDRLGSVWPNAWIQRYPHLGMMEWPIIDSDRRDQICWSDVNGNLVDFSVKVASTSIGGIHTVSSWHKWVWFPGNIARHAFCLWIACHRRLPTQDRMSIWVSEDEGLVCPLCEVEQDSHRHLFFQCVFAHDVWQRIKFFANLEEWPDGWDDIVELLSDDSYARKPLASKLFVAASVYYIWRERNNRLFRNAAISVDQIVQDIRNIVTMRLAWNTRRTRNQIHGPT